MSAQINSELYNAACEHSSEDIKKVIKLEEEEQKRRVSEDSTNGETHRRIVAHQVAELFAENLRSSWFHKGSSFVLSLFSTLRLAGREVLHSQPIANRFTAVQDVMSGAVHTLRDAVSSVQMYQKNALHNFAHSANMAFALMEMEQERARRMTSSSEMYAIENALKLSKMMKEHFGLPCNPDFVSDFYSITLAEEGERARRVSQAKSDKAAINNARTVSLLIKEQFGDQDEEGERARRVKLAHVDKAALDNARTVSMLIKDKFDAPEAAPAKGKEKSFEDRICINGERRSLGVAM